MRLVRDYIFKDISSVNDNSDLRRVILVMKRHQISAVPIVNQLGEYLGCISDKDIVEASVPQYMKLMYNTAFIADMDQVTRRLKTLLNEKAILFIDKKYPVLKPNDAMSYAADLLFRSQRPILPVVDGKLLIGWISRIEILSVSLEKET